MAFRFELQLRVLDRLNTFEGRSQFTTWVHKIAIRIAFSELPATLEGCFVGCQLRRVLEHG